MTTGFNWEYDFEPGFPLHIFSFVVKGNRDRMHWHLYFEIGLCTKGSGQFIYMNKVYPVKPGDLFISNNFENHVAISDGEKSTEYLFLIFLPTFISNPQDCGFNLDYISLFKYNPLTFQNKIDANLPIASELSGLIHEMYRISKENETYRKLAMDIKLREILLKLTIHYNDSTTANDSKDESIPPKIQQAIHYINTHFSEKITVNKMAKLLSMNPSYFRHYFKKHTQITFKTYLTHLRISQARKLMLATETPIVNIIKEVGFSNMNQFYIVFRKLSNMSPKEFRAKFQQVA